MFPPRSKMKMIRALSAAALLAVTTTPLAAQEVPWTPLNRGSDNIEVLGHLPLGPRLSVADMDVEQELDRPFAYVARMVYGFEGPKGTDIISIADPENPELLYEWRIENQDLHQRTGGMDVKHFKWNDRYYLVQSLQFGQGGPNTDLGAPIYLVKDGEVVSTIMIKEDLVLKKLLWLSFILLKLFNGVPVKEFKFLGDMDMLLNMKLKDSIEMQNYPQ